MKIRERFKEGLSGLVVDKGGVEGLQECGRCLLMVLIQDMKCNPMHIFSEVSPAEENKAYCHIYFPEPASLMSPVFRVLERNGETILTRQHICLKMKSAGDQGLATLFWRT